VLNQFTMFVLGGGLGVTVGIYMGINSTTTWWMR
jgi:hypothetical protein